MILCGVAEHNTAYDLPDLAAALQIGNWFAEQDETEDYGDDGYSSEVPVGELLENDRCFEIIKGWTMAKQSVPISDRFKFVNTLGRFRNNDNYRHKSLTTMKTIEKYYTQEDLALLNKLLRGVKRK